MIRRPPRSTQSRSSAASDVYKRQGMDRPAMAQIRHRLDVVCLEHGLRPPSRASLYSTLSRIPGHAYQVSLLPPHVRAALYNLSDDAEVPGHQLVFYCVNYGSFAVVSYAASLPWLDLYQASHLRGWRPRSRGLLHAAMRVRGIR